MNEAAEGTSRSKGLTVSREIRAGDLLQVAGFFIAAAAAWTAMDTRVTKVEERQAAQAVSIQEVRADIRDNIHEIRADAKETQTLVRSIENRISRKGL